MSSDFFEPPPPPPEPPPWAERPPVWAGPPGNMLGAAVGVRLVLARTDDFVVAITHATAYPTGLEFTVAIRRRPREGVNPYEDDPLASHGLFRRHARGGWEIPPEVFRFGVELADGSKATNLATPWLLRPDEQPNPPVLSQHGGGGGGGRWEQEFWLWPLPPPGPFAFVCEWPAQGIPLTRAEIDASVIRDAAEQAETLWPE